jgi:hypothetical protein
MHQRQTSFLREILYIPQRADVFLKLELLVDLSNLENETTTLFRNAGNQLLGDAA